MITTTKPTAAIIAPSVTTSRISNDRGFVAGGDGIVRILKTEQIGDSYIRADGKRVRKVKTIVVKRRKKCSTKQQHTSSSSSTTTICPEDGSSVIIYTRDDGTRVRRIRKILRRKKSTKQLLLNNTTTTDGSSQIENGSDDVNNRSASSIPGICNSMDNFNIQTTSTSPQQTKFNIRPASTPSQSPTAISLSRNEPVFNEKQVISEKNNSDMNNDGKNINSNSSNVEESVEIYINEYGQKIRRTRRRQKKFDDTTTDDDDMTYINDKGQKVRKVRKTRKRDHSTM